MSDLMKQKLDIAKQAGKLHAELSGLARYREIIEMKKLKQESVHVAIGNHETIDSYIWDKEGTSLHDLVLGWIEVQIEKRETELNDLIKILS